LATVDVQPGETTQVELGKSDRTVILRLRCPAGWQRQSGWRVGVSIGTPTAFPPEDLVEAVRDHMQNPSIDMPSPVPPEEARRNQQTRMQWLRQNQALLSSVRSYLLKESGDGSWTADDVPSGSYVVRVFVRDTNGPAGPESWRGRFESPAVVPNNSTTSTLDLGDLPLQPAAR
jgi:hypothetical protein